MKKLLIYLFVLLAPLTGVALLSPGCAQPCDDLADRCDECGDEDYRKSCLAAVEADNQSLCSAQQATFDKFCLGSGGNGGSGGNNVGSCTNGTVLCEGQCVDILNDPKYCGNCLKGCSGESDAGLPLNKCFNGQCVSDCPDGFAECPSNCADGNPGCESCANVQGDPRNCGGCGNACAEGEVCDDGDCAEGCAAGKTECNGGCADFDTDETSCGTCGNSCGNNQLCIDGTCTEDCAPGAKVCGSDCVDKESNPLHCGECDNVCGNDLVCSKGECKADCDEGLTACGKNCVDLNTSVLRCGNCNAPPCAPGAICATTYDNATPPVATSECGCENGLTLCAAGCVVPANDPAACGGCVEDGGMACAAGQKCAAGACVDMCPAGTTDCNGSCADLVNDTNFCGSCSTSCDDDNVCTVDSCDMGECKHVSAGALCNDGNPCTEDLCDPQKACVSTLYEQADWEALCQQLAGTPLPAGGCITCNATAETDTAACVGVPAANLNDGLSCTIDSCPQQVVVPIPMLTDMLHTIDPTACMAPTPTCNPAADPTMNPTGCQ